MFKRTGALWIVFVAGSAAAQVSLINAGGATLEDLVGTDTYVTVVLNVTNARDANLQVVGIGGDYVSFMMPNGQRTAYRFSAIKEIRVQQGKERKREARSGSGRILSNDDKDVVKRAVMRASEIFRNAEANQHLKMQAASVLAATGSENHLYYLQKLSEVNDTPTALKASVFLYLAGGTPEHKVLENGLASGSRRTKASALALVGTMGDGSFQEEISDLLKDSSADIFSVAARATALTGDRSGIPRLLKNMRALNEEKGDAAVFALGLLGGDEVHQAMNEMFETSKGMEWFRVLQVLYALGDPSAEETLRLECLKVPAFAREAAILLGRKGEWDSSNYLRSYLEKTRDPDRANLENRARVAAALVEGGDVQAKNVLQKLLRMKDSDIFARGRASDKAYKRQTLIAVQVKVCNLIAGLGTRNVLSLTQPAIESQIPEVATAACEAAIAIAHPEYQARLKQSRL